MARLIDAEALIEKCGDWYVEEGPEEGFIGKLKSLIDEQPTIRPDTPRVMTLDEVVAHYSLPPAFVDDFGAQEDYYEDIHPLYFEFPHQEEDKWIVHWRGHAQVARYLDNWKHTYNKKWRCWTAQPTDEQRKAAKWDGEP